jgi:hypothetical protein
MKKIISMLAMAVLAVTAMSSCIDDAEVTAYLTPAAKDQIAADDPDKAFAAAVAGIYSDVQSYVYADVKHNYFGHMSFGYLCSLMGNDMIMTGRYAMSLYHYLLDYWQENYDPTSNRWREYYRHVDSANKMIESIADDEENPEVLKYKAVALALRGFGYLHLSYLYGLPYYMGADDTVWGKGEKYDNANTPCVPIVTDEITGDQPRATVGAVSDLIVDDLETAYNMFKEFGMVKTANPGDIDGCVAAQYLARAYMIRHDWENAAKYAQVVIDNYSILKGRDQICQGFSSINLPDVVWGCDITADNTGTYMSFFSQMDMFGDGYAGIGVWRAAFRPLVERISNTDIRLDWFFDAARNGDKIAAEFGLSKYWAAGAWPYVNYESLKFIGAGRANVIPGTGYGEGWHLGDYIYLRSEEAHFIKAEALAHMGDANAVKVLNDFMVTRDPKYSYTFTDKAALIEEIIFQKRVEFWGEGMEYLDNRRLNIPVDRTKETWGNKTNHMSGAQLYASQDDRNFLYQLPQTEIDNNSALTKDDQN